MAHILIVDDEEAVRDTLCDLFAAEHVCHTAATAEEALGRLEEAGRELERSGVETYDVVVTDISMPGMSGLELLARIRQRQPDTPVIIISGIDYQQYSGALIRMGAFDYLLKPFGLDDIAECVGRAVAHHRVGAGERARDRLVPQPGPGDAEAESELMRLEEEWAEAYLRGDGAAFERILAHDFALTHPWGVVMSKAEVVTDVGAVNRFEFYVTFDVHGSVFGDIAVVTGRALIKGEWGGRDASGQYRYSHTYAKRYGKWLAISALVTPVQGP